MTTETVSRFRRPLLKYPIGTAVLYAMVGSFPLLLAGAYAVRIQEDLLASKTQFGLAAAAYFAAGAIGSLRVGRLVDRHGSQFGGIASAVGASAGCLLIGIFASNWWMVAAGLGMTGFSNTAGQLSGNRILAASVGTQRQGRGFGVKQAAVPMGGFIAGSAVSVLGLGVSWRTSFIVYAFVALILAVIAPQFGAAKDSEIAAQRGVGDDRPALIVLALAGLLVGAAGNGLAVLVVDAFETANFDPSVAARALAIGSVSAIAGRIGIGWIVDRRGGNGFAELIGIIVIGALGFFSLAFAGTNPVLLWLGVSFGFAAGWGWPAIIYFVTVRASSAPPGTSTGFVLTGVFSGAIVGAPLFAWIAETVSYDIAWVTAGVMCLGSAAGIEVARRMSNPRSPAQR